MDLARNQDQGKTVFVGIDVHKKTYALHIVPEGGLVRRLTIPAKPPSLAHWLTKNYPEAKIKSVYEAGFAGFVLHRILIAAGIENIVVNAASIPISANSRVKTDKIDSNRLADELRKGGLVGIYVPPVKDELARLLPRTRAQLVVEKTRIGNQIKSKLFEFGFLEMDDDRAMSLKFLRELENYNLPVELSCCLNALENVYKLLHQEIRSLEKALEKQAEDDSERERIIRSAPGVGPVSSRIIATELGDIGRFANERRIFSFTGLTPTEHSSGERERKGGITHQGSTYLRHCLVEIAWRAIRIDKKLAEVYERIKIRRGGKRAIVAVARKLIGQIRACLLAGRLYNLTKAAV